MQNKLRFFRKLVEGVTRETREGILKERESSKSLNVIWLPGNHLFPAPPRFPALTLQLRLHYWKGEKKTNHACPQTVTDMNHTKRGGMLL